MPDDLTFDLAFASKSLTGFAVEYITLGLKYPEPGLIPADVATRVAQSMDDALKSGLMLLREVGRMRSLIEEQRRTHLPMPSAAPGVPVVCQQCSLGGSPVPWQCGVWKFADAVLADGA